MRCNVAAVQDRFPRGAFAILSSVQALLNPQPIKAIA